MLGHMFRSFDASAVEPYMLREITLDVSYLQMGPAEANMPVRAQKIEGLPGNLSTRQLCIVQLVVWENMDERQVSKRTAGPWQICRLSEHQQVEARVVELLK